MWIASSRCTLRDRKVPKFSWGGASHAAYTCTIFCLTKAKVLRPPLTCSQSPTEVSPRAPCIKKAEKPSPATDLSPAEDSSGKCTHQFAQELLPLTATAGV